MERNSLLCISLVFLIVKVSNGQQVYFSDNFENGLGQWTRSGQDWDTTSATSRAGRYCITDSPQGNYPAYANEAISTTSILNLSGATYPVLSFWHKYLINPGSGYPNYDVDYAYVEVSTDAGFTWMIGASFTGYQNTWSQVLVDLRGYRTALTKVRFRLVSGCCSESDGWYLDNVEIKEFNIGSAVSLPFSDGFEGGFGNWIRSGRDWDTTSATSRAGNYCIGESRTGNYPPYANSSITIAGSLDLTNTTFPVLSFWHKYLINPSSGYPNYDVDHAYVEISTDAGFTWTIDTSFTGYQSTWSQVLVDLSDYRTDTIKVRFRVVSGCCAEDDGWYVDDVEVRDEGVVPIQLHYLNAIYTGKGRTALITWGTLSEINNYGFEVQKSQDATIGYETLPNSFVAGHGTTIVPYDYTFVDSSFISELPYYRLKQIDLDGTVHYTDGVKISTPTGAEKIIPREFSLSQNYPNPFNPSTKIRFALAKSTNVKIEVFDLLGRRVAVLLNERKQAGYHEVEFSGENLSSGVYLYHIITPEFQQVRKMALVR